MKINTRLTLFKVLYNSLKPYAITIPYNISEQKFIVQKTLYPLFYSINILIVYSNILKKLNIKIMAKLKGFLSL